MTEARAYHLEAPDRTGWLLGLDGPQVIAAGGGILLGLLVLKAGLPFSFALVPMLVGGALAGVRVGDARGLAAIPIAWQWAQHRLGRVPPWYAPIRFPADGQPALPPCLAGQRILEVDPLTIGLGPGEPIAVVHDAVTGLVAASVRAAGRQFVLAEPDEQDRSVALWGTVLGPLSHEDTPVASLRWSEWAAPAGIEEQRGWLTEHRAANADPAALAAYEQLLEHAGPVATRHETLLTLSVARSRVRLLARHHGDRTRAAVDALGQELRLLVARLQSAGLTVSHPLGGGELARVLRVRLDPTVLPTLDRRGRSLGDRAGLVALANAGPSATASGWRHWQVDDSLHRCYRVAEWPRGGVRAAWLQDLLLHATGVRTICVTYEPVAPSASFGAIRRQSTKIDSDAQHRAKNGLRVGGAHRRAAQAVENREEELLSGFAELTYVGLVDVCAPDDETLELCCAQLVSTAAAVGVELRPLHGRHDVACAAVLPLARGLRARGLT